MFKKLCLLLDTQVGEDLILPDQVDSTQAAPGAGLYQPQEFRIPVGPIFNFVTGKLNWRWIKYSLQILTGN